MRIGNAIRKKVQRSEIKEILKSFPDISEANVNVIVRYSSDNDIVWLDCENEFEEVECKIRDMDDYLKKRGDDERLGGYYSYSLLKSANIWYKNQNGMYRTNCSIVKAHKVAVELTKRKVVTNNIHKSKSQEQCRTFLLSCMHNTE